MKVTLIASTMMHTLASSAVAAGYGWDVSEQADQLAEFAGRACYQSWTRPNPKTRENVDYMKHILDVGHESVLEHASATFYIEGVSRSLTHELIRHRHLSFSQLSQRYVNGEDTDMVYPPAAGYLEAQAIADVRDLARDAYKAIVENLTASGLSRKQAREAARAVLPNATETKIVVTGNHRAWRDVLKKRWHVAADAEIRLLAGELLRQLREIAPNTYQDVPEVPYG